MTRQAFGQLEPERDVERREHGFMALSEEPWLHLEVPDLRRLAGRFVELTYRSSFWDEPVRPIFRFWTSDSGFIDRIAIGPIVGAAIWTGRVPIDVTRISVSPTNRRGPFGFEVERGRTRSWSALVAEGWHRRKRSARSAVLTRLIGWKPESDVNLAWAIASEPLSEYDIWRRRREGPLDFEKLDRPRVDWSRAPPIRVFITGVAAEAMSDSRALCRTLASLEAQIFPSWRALVVDCDASSAASGRVVSATLEEAVASVSDDGDNSLTTVLAAGDQLLPRALALLTEQAARYPSRSLFYGDEVQMRSGTRMPIFRAGWNHGLASSSMSGYGSFVRGFAAWPIPGRRQFIASGVLPSSFLGALERDQVQALRRLVLETDRPPEEPRTMTRLVAPSGVRASIIIPTRDHPALLRRILASIRTRSRPGSHDVVVVDNGSTAPEARALLAELRSQSTVLVLDDARPFDFSAMCNNAAAASRGEVLVFLNDDMEILSEGWLDRLCALALEPSVGAVGAKLTYPDGRLQHVGVLVGMGGSAGHFGALDPGDSPGWAGRNLRAHAVSAVTGACLAVERRKFEAVGGFDAEHLPVELSDIDLCLKLNARGWQTMVDPFVHLMHEESVSRGGATLRRLDVYGGQRAIFVERWRHVLRDDPAFHPGLSLYSSQPALG